MANIVKTEKSANIAKFKSFLSTESVQEQFRNALQDSSQLFVASLIDLVISDDTLCECQPSLIIAEAFKAATVRLPINKALGFAYVIPYNKNVKVGNTWTKVPIPTFIMGYKGYIQLAMRTGQYRFINADVVYDGELVSRNKLSGAVDLSGQRKSEMIVGYFAYFELLNGFQKCLYWSTEELTVHAQRRSPAYDQKAKKFNDKSSWATDFDAMAKKTMLRNLLSKFGVMSVEMQKAFDYDNDAVDTTLVGNTTLLPDADMPDAIPTVDIGNVADGQEDMQPREQVLPEELGDDDWPLADKASE